MKAVVIGASAGVGRALSRQLAAQGNELFLVARDSRDLEALAADFRLRFGAHVHVLVDDAADPRTALMHDFAAEKLGRIDALFVIAGMTDLSDTGAMEDDRLEAVIRANFLGPVRIINALLSLCGPQSDIIAAGSVAAIRPRGGNAAYGAAKLGLEHYVMAIRHRFGSNLRSVRCYRLGYIHTSMIFGQEMLLPAANPEAVAAEMIRGLGDSGVSYFPRWWALVALCLRMMPWAIFKKLRV